MEPFKNNFSPELVTCIADHLEKCLPTFNRVNFEVSVLDSLEMLELKERVQLIADHLNEVLPVDHKKRYRILREMLHPVEDADIALQSDVRGIRGWGMLPLTAVVGQHGVGSFDESLALLKEMTSRFSSELDVRYFLLADQERAINIMKEWVNHPNHHVRRLVSEGTRPRLPWAMQLPKLIADPTPMIPLLKALRDDEEEYVRRSVANHLNDISKDHPELVADLAKAWIKRADKPREKLLRHACRTLIKQGHPDALEAFGYGAPEIVLKDFVIESKNVIFGESLVFDICLKSTSRVSQSLIIDYLIHFKKSNGSLAAKVFKWKKISIMPGQELTLKRSHAIRPITTRKYYGGEHAVSLRINGVDFGYESFMLNIRG